MFIQYWVEIELLRAIIAWVHSVNFVNIKLRQQRLLSKAYLQNISLFVRKPFLRKVMDFSMLIRIQEFIEVLSILHNRRPISLCTALFHVQFIYDGVYITEHCSPSEPLISSNNEFRLGQTTRYKNEQAFRSKPAVNRVVISSKNSWTVNGLKFSLQHLCNFCPHILTIFFSILLPQTIYVFPYPQSPTRLCGYH